MEAVRIQVRIGPRSGVTGNSSKDFIITPFKFELDSLSSLSVVAAFGHRDRNVFLCNVLTARSHLPNFAGASLGR
jgi:hypothetical protein